MAIISFKMTEVRKLLEELEGAESFTPTIEDQFNPELYVGGKVVDKNGNEEGSPDFHWPDASKMKSDCIQPQLLLVKDQGVYLIVAA